MYRYKGIDITVAGYHGYDGFRSMYCFDLCLAPVIKTTYHSIISELPLTMLHELVSCSGGKNLVVVDAIDKLCFMRDFSLPPRCR
jgi:hypothetical protein